MSTNALMVERIKEQMKKTGISARELAEKADVGRSFIYDILSGKSSNPTTKKIAAVAGVLGVSVPYLLDENADPENTVSEYVKVPIVVKYTKAESMLIEDKSEKYFYFQREFLERFNAVTADLRILTVEGDGMEPTLCHNDIILVDLGKKLPSPAGVFAVFDGMGVAVKRIEFIASSADPKMLHVHSDNARYASYASRPEDIHTIGRVIWFSRPLS